MYIGKCYKGWGYKPWGMTAELNDIKMLLNLQKRENFVLIYNVETPNKSLIYEHNCLKIFK